MPIGSPCFSWLNFYSLEIFSLQRSQWKNLQTGEWLYERKKTWNSFDCYSVGIQSTFTFISVCATCEHEVHYEFYCKYMCTRSTYTMTLTLGNCVHKVHYDLYCAGESQGGRRGRPEQEGQRGGCTLGKNCTALLERFSFAENDLTNNVVPGDGWVHNPDKLAKVSPRRGFRMWPVQQQTGGQPEWVKKDYDCGTRWSTV